MNTTNKILFNVLTLFTVLCLSISQETNAQNSIPKETITGFFVPNGEPVNRPVRIDAGDNCIIDLIQDYSISGDISGLLK